VQNLKALTNAIIRQAHLSVKQKDCSSTNLPIISISYAKTVAEPPDGLAAPTHPKYPHAWI
jgi:hypothetical protein